MSNPSAAYSNVWSMSLDPNDPTDNLVTTLESEKDALLLSGWTQMCNPFGVGYMVVVDCFH